MDSHRWARSYAHYCSSKFSGPFEREDLQSAGLVGYVKAASRYEENRGTSFRGFCAVRIRGAVFDELRRMTWESRSARHEHQCVVEKTLALEATLQRPPTPVEVADALGIALSDLMKIQELAQPARCLSLDESTESSEGEESVPLRESIPDQSAVNPSDGILSAEMMHLLFAAIVKLPQAQATVVVLHYLRNVPLKEIAKGMGLTAARISQLHHTALAALKKHLAKIAN